MLGIQYRERVLRTINLCVYMMNNKVHWVPDKLIHTLFIRFPRQLITQDSVEAETILIRTIMVTNTQPPLTANLQRKYIHSIVIAWKV